MRMSRFMFHHNTSVFPSSIMIFVIVFQHVQPSPVYLTVPVQRYHKEKSSKADDEESGGHMKCYSIQTKQNNYKGYPSAIAKPKTRTKKHLPLLPLFSRNTQ